MLFFANLTALREGCSCHLHARSETGEADGHAEVADHLEKDEKLSLYGAAHIRRTLGQADARSAGRAVQLGRTIKIGRSLAKARG